MCVDSMLERYIIEHRYQDSGWEFSGRSKAKRGLAIKKAKKMSKKPIIWGMTRVIDTEKREIICTFSNGEISWKLGNR